MPAITDRGYDRSSPRFVGCQSNECGVSCEIHVLNLGQDDQKAADYLKINPTARIPTLIDPGGPGGKPLTVTQSWAILMYLCEKTGKFLPPDPVARVRMFQ